METETCPCGRPAVKGAVVDGIRIPTCSSCYVRTKIHGRYTGPRSDGEFRHERALIAKSMRDDGKSAIEIARETKVSISSVYRDLRS